MGICKSAENQTSEQQRSTILKKKASIANTYIAVHSFVTRHSAHTYIPRELIQLILNFVKDDEIWHPNNINMIDELNIIVTDSYIERKDKSEIWSHMFGNTIIKYKEKKIWELKINDASTYGKVLAIIGIVDMEEIDEVTNKNEFTYSCVDAFGLYGYNGNIIGGHHEESQIYTKPLKNNDIVRMELDMTISNGTLHYWINNKDCGLAFDNINTTQKYKLAVAIHDKVAIEIL
eukprot:107693_1